MPGQIAINGNYTCILLLNNIFELLVITSLVRINWLAPNFGTRNDLIAICISPDRYFSEGAGGARLSNTQVQPH